MTKARDEQVTVTLTAGEMAAVIVLASLGVSCMNGEPEEMAESMSLISRSPAIPDDWNEALDKLETSVGIIRTPEGLVS